ncbi:hypothetical protein GCM10023115_44340 [Pontixanthobacter gangjinensis]|uniref:Uncharacterized protein n=1 Tax=Christiangramia aestuarii TaxID=1028746 RepID=A0A7M3SXZ2_9FLAO|nr:hypothetical protein [Christiangramia aestuarii]MUP41473.1 hypothetical protein [Christiangramia aestuarii]
MKPKRLLTVLLVVVSILLIPFIAMQFDTGVDWSPFDFLVMGFLLLITGLAIEFALRKITGTGKRIIVCGVILVVFFMIWAELAVGIFGTPFAGS